MSKDGVVEERGMGRMEGRGEGGIGGRDRGRGEKGSERGEKGSGGGERGGEEKAE